jgi:PKD repeat protein
LDEVNLSDYLGQTIKVRFQLKSDGGSTGNGFFFDDFKILFNEAGAVIAPVSNFTASTTTICSGESIAFTDFSTNVPTAWAWDFGNGQTSTAQNPTQTFATPGTYTVALTVTNTAGSNTYQMTVNIQDCATIENLEKNGVSIVPNPNNGNFVIKGLELGTDFAIYDLNGKVIMKKAVTSKFEEIQLDGVGAGLYYLHTTKNGVVGQMKFAVL